MRNVGNRPVLSANGAAYLSKKTALIIASATPQETAEKIYTAARKTKVFLNSVVATLSKLSGKGERCLFCGSSEASQVDHFRPKADFPELAMFWENFIWICGVCNQNKGNSFPVDAASDPLLINPIEEDVWNLFALDRFGFMLPRWDVAIDDVNVRAKVTEETIKLNRQAVQEARNLRFQQLEISVQDCILLDTHGHITKDEMRKRLEEWLVYPFHPEVPQYFFKKDGALEEPFASFLKLI